MLTPTKHHSYDIPHFLAERFSVAEGRVLRDLSLCCLMVQPVTLATHRSTIHKEDCVPATGMTLLSGGLLIGQHVALS
jgi:hypothetical protein